jgi:enamine deaminase RidA (YjgF/YER057c/UK114 family)
MTTRSHRPIAPAILAAALLVATAAFCQTPASPSSAQASTAAASTDIPVHIPTRGGEVILPTARDQENYEQLGFAALRRVGDLVFVSGVVVGRRPDEGTDVEAFKAQVRRAFTRLQASLRAAGLSFEDVAMINTFHIWEGPNFAGTKAEQFKAFEQVKEEFMRGPKPAWTAVGTTGLLPDNGIVEIQMIAAAPEKRPRKR